MLDHVKELNLASDHAAVDTKAELVKWLEVAYPALVINDLGPYDTQSVDYPDYAEKLGRVVAQKPDALGIGLCGSGIGISIALNKVMGVRCALCHDVTTARLSREHNHANVLAVGARTTGYVAIQDIVRAFLESDTDKNERHQRRIGKIHKIENRS